MVNFSSLASRGQGRGRGAETKGCIRVQYAAGDGGGARKKVGTFDRCWLLQPLIRTVLVFHPEQGSWCIHQHPAMH